MAKILIIEDDADISAIERDYLELSGYQVAICADGTEGLSAALNEDYDLLLLDLMLPGTDGFTICRVVRERKDIPILMVTALGKDVDKIRGLGFGADDYIEKPFSPSVLVARVKALLRRVEMDRGKSAAAGGELHYGDIHYSATENAIFCGTVPVALTQTELRLLGYMMRQPEKAYSREDLLSAVWGFDSDVETRVTDETLRRIRKKLLQAGSTVSVSTIWGFGYKLKGAERT